jgi:NAD(P)-dependent dehydrogenase (short-subunit alcohol dehydrogenase family)
MNSTLEGKVALVTGGARGIGAATCRELAALGAEVVVTDVLDDEGTALADELRQSGHTAFYRHLDVADEDAWNETVAEVIARSGRMDILVNNAGIGTFEDVEAETLDGYRRVIGINQVGVWLGMRAVIPQMRAQGGGSIINVSSIFGAVGGFGGSIAYHASKGAVRLMTKNAAIRYAKEGIRVNSVHPGFIDTPMVEVAKGTDMETAILANTPMGRWGSAGEIATVIAFLAGDGASYMTGSEVYADGGWTAQ